MTELRRAPWQLPVASTSPRRASRRSGSRPVESFAKVLSQRNQELLTLIAREQPGSLTELAALSGRHKSNLSRTLKTISRYGLVELKEGQRGTLIPRVPYDRVSLDVLLTATPQQVA